MNTLNKSIKKSFARALIFTMFLPIGVVGIILTCTMHVANPYFALLLSLSIILAVLGFYGSPMTWVNYGSYVGLKNVLSLIENENIYSVQQISNQLSQNPKQVVTTITTLISKGYLRGYLFVDNDHLVLNTNTKLKDSKAKIKCENCGALTSQSLDFCEYCGMKLNK